MSGFKGHCMLDLEATAKSESGAILSLAGIIFDYYDTEPAYVDEFVAYFDLPSQLDEYGRTMDASTMEWWKKQDKEVMQQQFSGKEDLYDGLIRFNTWLEQYELEFYWCHNSSYDFPKLDHAYRVMNFESTFVNEFWKRNCAATITRATGLAHEDSYLAYNLKRKHEKTFGKTHDPLVDCKVQVEILKDCIIR